METAEQVVAMPRIGDKLLNLKPSPHRVILIFLLTIKVNG